jgi:hypothetical protein
MFMQLDGEFRILNVVGGRAEWDISFKWLCVLIKGGRIAPPKCASKFQRDLEEQGSGGGEQIQLEAGVGIEVERIHPLHSCRLHSARPPLKSQKAKTMEYPLPHIPKAKNKVRGGTDWFERTFIQGDIRYR